MAVRLALRRAREEARGRLRSASICRESTASAQTRHGSGARPAVAGSREAVRSAWRPNALADAQPLRWRAEHQDTPWTSSDEAVARRAHRARHRAREAATTLAAMDVGEAKSHSPTPRMGHQSGRRNRIVVDVDGLSPDGSVIDLTSSGIVRVPGFDGEE